ncbi:MAG TPA: DUF6636 domain-containing protein [Kineosporiaceae bacterium]
MVVGRWRGQSRQGAGAAAIARLVAAPVAALGLLAGCAAGGSTGSPAPTGAAGTAGGVQGVGPAGIGGVGPLLRPGAAGTASGGSASVGGGLPPATATRPVASGTPYAFTTPTKNIGCMIDAGQVRCDIRSRTWQAPPRPADCTLDYGNGVTLGNGSAGYVCAGDTTLDPDAAVLPYGAAVRAGDLVCVSTPAFLACRNLATGHGFALSKETPPPMD